MTERWLRLARAPQKARREKQCHENVSLPICRQWGYGERVRSERSRERCNPMTASPRAVGKSRSDDKKSAAKGGAAGAPPAEVGKSDESGGAKPEARSSLNGMCGARDSYSQSRGCEYERAPAKCADAYPLP